MSNKSKNTHQADKKKLNGRQKNEGIDANDTTRSPINHLKDTSKSSKVSKELSKPSTYDLIIENPATIQHKCRIDSAQLKRHTDPQTLPETTDQIKEVDIGFEQPRVTLALDTAFDIPAGGYNVFAIGENGLGKRTFITNYLKKKARKQAPLADWVYVHNFESPLMPLAIPLKPNSAIDLTQRLQDIWHTFSQLINEDVDSKQPPPSTIQHTLTRLFNDIKASHHDNSRLAAHLDAIKHHMLSTLDETTYPHIPHSCDERHRYRHSKLKSIPSEYTIHIMSVAAHSHCRHHAHTTSDGAPIVYLDAPTLSNLMGHIAYATCSGTVISDVSMIRPGALHHANGGYLIIEAARILQDPKAWFELKRALQNKHIEFDASHNNAGLARLSLTPDPIPLTVKVILLGTIDTYDKFIEQDAEFEAVFKIRAEFYEHIDRTLDHELAMVSKMASICKKHQLLAFDRSAQAAILDNLSLEVEDQNKLSLHMDRLTQLMLEANRHALKQPASQVESRHIDSALTDMEYRLGYLKELYWQELTDGQQLISTSGMAIGQVNALTVIESTDIEFGMPARLTAVVQHSAGSGDILDIERDVELGGSLHAKGMLIMNSYLRALFSPFHPLNFTASLAFEQSYAHIDGDSATLAEACALLSALADSPLSQSLAITGSMNQLGMVQAVGGVNAKVNGFFDVCCHQGLTGNQGVILPYANISQLMLRSDIIEAVDANQFHIYGVKTLSQALTILSGMPIDSVNKKGRYRKSSLFGKVLKNLKKWDAQLNPQDDIELVSDKVIDNRTKG